MCFMPSIHDAKHTASKRYGFAEGSGDLSSILVPLPLFAGTLMSGLLFFNDRAILVGASYQGTSLLYELTVGFAIAVIAFACFIIHHI